MTAPGEAMQVAAGQSGEWWKNALRDNDLGPDGCHYCRPPEGWNPLASGLALAYD